MKKILLILSILIVSCSKEDLESDCGCVKETFVTKTETVIRNGLPSTRQINTLINSESVNTCDEQEPTSTSSNRWFRITCNKN